MGVLPKVGADLRAARGEIVPSFYETGSVETAAKLMHAFLTESEKRGSGFKIPVKDSLKGEAS